jgi:DNA-binding MarR family transcriptional regulator
VPETPDQAAVAARELVVVLSRLRRRLREMRDDDGLSPSQTSVLSRLEKDGPATASELAGAERVRPQSMAATVSVLIELGLVRRDPDPNDGRRQVLSVSADGRARVAHTRRVREEWLVAALRSTLSDDELRTVVEALALVDRATLR